MHRKGAVGLNKLIGGLLIVVAAASLGGTIFGNDGLNSSTFVAAAPAWVVTLMIIVTGIGLVMLIYNSFGKA